MNAKGTIYTQIEIDELAHMYSSGIYIYKICKILSRSETLVKNHLKKLGIFVPTEAIVEVDELNFKWLYWFLIPFWIIKAQSNSVNTILFLIFE